MYLIDNDIFNLLIAGNSVVADKVQRNQSILWLSSIAAEEILTGHLSGINRARSAQNALSLPKAHDRFVRTLENLLLLPVFSYSEEAETVYQTFAPATLRIGPQDCRIAAQALAHNMTIVTRNLRDFQAIGAPCEDWSAE